MKEITQIRKLSLWIFLIPLLAINLCLFISQNPEFLNNTIFDKYKDKLDRNEDKYYYVLFVKTTAVVIVCQMKRQNVILTNKIA